MRIFIGLSFDRDHTERIVGASATHAGAKSLVERYRGETLHEEGSALDDATGDMVGHVLGVELEQLYRYFPVGCDECGGSGAVDSGGQREDGKFIEVPCGKCSDA